MFPQVPFPLDPQVVAAGALVALLVVAFAHPRGRVEVLVGCLCVAAVVATGGLTRAKAADVLEHLGPVLAFLVAILVVADVCARAGVFLALGQRMRGVRGRARFLTAVFATAVVVTLALSLDATVVLLTPVVLAAADTSHQPSSPSTWACLRVANSGSLLLPVANLTNLIALPLVALTFADFVRLAALPWLAVLVVEYVALRILLTRHPRTPPSQDAPGPPRPIPALPVAVVGVMLLAIAAASTVGIEPAWPASAAAVGLVVWGWRRRLLRWRGAARAAHLPFAFFVLCLGLVVAALESGPVIRALQEALPTGDDSFSDLLLIAVVATVVACAVTNLSAALVLIPLVAPLGDSAVMAALIGLNAGAGLLLSGSLANLLWRRTMVRHQVAPTLWEFHTRSLLTTPVAVLAGVAALSLVS